jgi:hypothetical protein
VTFNTSIATYAHQNIKKELRKIGRRKEGGKTARNTGRRKNERT